MSFKPLVVAGLICSSLAATAAWAHVDVNIGVGIPGVIAAPAPVYVPAAPVVVAPAPVVMAPAPVMAAPGYAYGHDRHWREEQERRHERERREHEHERERHHEHRHD